MCHVLDGARNNRIPRARKAVHHIHQQCIDILEMTLDVVHIGWILDHPGTPLTFKTSIKSINLIIVGKCKEVHITSILASKNAYATQVIIDIWTLSTIWNASGIPKL